MEPGRFAWSCCDASNMGRAKSNGGCTHDAKRGPPIVGPSSYNTTWGLNVITWGNTDILPQRFELFGVAWRVGVRLLRRHNAGHDQFPFRGPGRNGEDHH